MESLYRLEAVVLLLGAVLVLMAVARRIVIPYPIFLVLGGLVLGFVPGVPAVRLDPEVVFLIFLPPILWAAAYFTSLRDFQANIRPISLLAVGLVLATTAGVAAAAHAIVPGLGWPAAFVLGAIVSPPDAVAATAIARRLRIPHRIVTILEGESLVNDAAALVLYRAAVIATVTGAFVLGETLWQFVLAAVGGVAIGLAVGYVTREALHHAEDSLVETAITLLVPYAAWILAERVARVGGAGVRRRRHLRAPGLQRGRAAHDTAPGAGGLGPPRLRPERRHLRADRAPAPGDPRRRSRGEPGAPRPVRRRDQRRRDRDSPRSGCRSPR